METKQSSLSPKKSNDASVIFRSESDIGNLGSAGLELESSEECDVTADQSSTALASEPKKSPESSIGDSKIAEPQPFVPSLGAWSKPPSIVPDIASNETPSSMAALLRTGKGNISSGKPPPEVKSDGTFRFPWAAKMDPSSRNLYKTTSPSYMEDGTPKVHIPNHVLMKGLENQKEYIIGQFYRCRMPSGGLIHAVTNRLWGRKCKVFTRKLGESSYLFHIPDKSTRDWVLQRGLWHIDDCIMFVAPWTSAATLALPEIATVPVWVTLKSIPSRLYSIEAICWIASGLGEPMVTNKPWLDPTQIGTAKLMVEVELEKGFPERIAVEDTRGNVSLVDVEYSWLPTKCKQCGQLGHKESRCLSRSDQSSDQAVLEHATVSIAQPTEQLPTVDVTTDIARSEEIQISGDSANEVCFAAPKEATIDCDSLTVSTGLATSAAAINVASPISSATIVSTPPVSCHVNAPVFSDLRSFAPKNTELAMAFGVPTDQISGPNSPKPSSESALNFGGNQFAALDEGVYAGFEMGDSSYHKTKGGRTVKPTQKMQDMNWIVAAGRGKRGRGGRGGRGSLH